MRRARALALVAALVAGVAGVVGFAPVYLPALPAAAPPLPDGPARVFGYATLTHPAVRLVVVGRPVPAEGAALHDWRRDGRTIVPDPGAMTPGRVFTVAPAGLRRLDRYERAGVRYARRRMVLADGSRAWVYRRLPVAGD